MQKKIIRKALKFTFDASIGRSDKEFLIIVAISEEMTILKTKSLEPNTSNHELTADDQKIIKDTWNLVRQDMKNYGLDLFINLFKVFPDYQQQFRSFANVPIDELRSNKRLLAHTNNVIYTLTGVLDSIDDREVFEEMVQKMAENHIRRKVKLTQFENLGLVLIDLLVDKLGDQVMDETAIDAWKKAYLLMLTAMKIAFNNEIT